jgi:hypothetical protein
VTCVTAKRKHVTTGKRPSGGKRAGAGRPKGTANALEYGEVKALAAAGLRVPEGTAPGIAELAAIALQRIFDAMMERCGFGQGQTVMKAATHLREEICGGLAQKLVVSGLESLTDEQLEAKHRALRERITRPESRDSAEIPTRSRDFTEIPLAPGP